MSVMRSDIREVLPAAGAFVVVGFGHDGSEVAAFGHGHERVHAPTRTPAR